MDWLVNLLSDPGTGTPVLILAVMIGIPALAWMVVSLTRLVATHRERIAMIEQGIDPDVRVGKSGSKASA
jgi:hypothetical protein